jgi:uncharacterized protein
MKDGPLRRTVKAVARAAFFIDTWRARGFRRAGGEAVYDLGGECRRCARCCEAPAISVPAVVSLSPLLRRSFLRWQERVNGFVLVEERRAERTFVFRCTHFDPATRSCDSYASRPGVCRDYPRNLLQQTTPEMLPGCGYRAVARNAGRMLRVLETQPLTPRQRDKLRKELHLQ